MSKQSICESHLKFAIRSLELEIVRNLRVAFVLHGLFIFPEVPISKGQCMVVSIGNYKAMRNSERLFKNKRVRCLTLLGVLLGIPRPCHIFTSSLIDSSIVNRKQS